MTIGIYKLTFPSGAFYIGQSINIEDRGRKHNKLMLCGKHSKKLQNEYDKCKILPTLEILAECSREELNTYENECIDIYDSVNKGLNTLEKAEDIPIKYGEEHPNAKYLNEQYEQVFLLLVEGILTYKEISDKLNVTLSVITSIRNGGAHIWLKHKYPKEYGKMLQVDRNREYSRGNSGIPVVQNRPILQAPNGSIYDLSGCSVNAFAKEHGLHQSSLTNLLNGKRKSCQGWKLLKELNNE